MHNIDSIYKTADVLLENSANSSNLIYDTQDGIKVVKYNNIFDKIFHLFREAFWFRNTRVDKTCLENRAKDQTNELNAFIEEQNGIFNSLETFNSMENFYNFYTNFHQNLPEKTDYKVQLIYLGEKSGFGTLEKVTEYDNLIKNLFNLDFHSLTTSEKRQLAIKLQDKSKDLSSGVKREIVDYVNAFIAEDIAKNEWIKNRNNVNFDKLNIFERIDLIKELRNQKREATDPSEKNELKSVIKYIYASLEITISQE